MRFLLVAAMLSAPSAVSAQESCVQALLQDKAQLDLSESSSLALAQLLRQSKNSSESWSAGITIPIKGIPVNLSAAQAKQATEEYFQSSNMTWTHERLVSVATQTLSAGAVEAYKACIGARRDYGPRITVHDATPTQVTVRIRWDAPTGAPPQSTATIGITGGQLTQPFPVEWQTRQSYSRIVQRDPKADFRITADIGGETDHQIVAYLPPVSITPPLTLMMGSCLGRGGLDGVRLWGPASEFCNGMSPWGKYDAQIRNVTALGSCLGKGGVNGVRLYGPAGEPCAGFPEWGTYESAVDVRRDGIASCIGRGNILSGHRLWGPAGAACGGMSTPEWGTYSEFNRKPG